MFKYFIVQSLLLINMPLVAQIDSNLVEDFARNFSYKNRIHIDEVTAILDQAEFQPKIIESMNRPAEKMPWHKYRNIFMTDERIDAGIEFWNENRATIKQVSLEYKVDPEIIVAIIGVESYFGRRKGNYKILDALYTLAFGYPKRSKFFTAELATFILLTRKENLDVYNVKGSYAGAMGYGQFMPSSYEAYARSFEKDGNKDLMNSAEDAIASVANYFKEHRWRLGSPIAQKATQRPDAQPLGKHSVRPKNNTSFYQDLGYEPTMPISEDELVSVQAFDLEDRKEYWFTHQNFYVITRYNHSALYALAVFQLSEAIKEKLIVD